MESLASAANRIWELSVAAGFGRVRRDIRDPYLDIHQEDCWRASIKLVVVSAHLSRHPEFNWRGRYYEIEIRLLLIKPTLDEYADKICGRALFTLANEHGSRGDISGLRWTLELAIGLGSLDDFVGTSHSEWPINHFLIRFSGNFFRLEIIFF